MNQYKITIYRSSYETGDPEVNSIFRNIGKRWFENIGYVIVKAYLPFYVTNWGKEKDPDEIANNFAFLFNGPERLTIEMNGIEWTEEQYKSVYGPLYRKEGDFRFDPVMMTFSYKGDLFIVIKEKVIPRLYKGLPKEKVDLLKSRAKLIQEELNNFDPLKFHFMETNGSDPFSEKEMSVPYFKINENMADFHWSMHSSLSQAIELLWKIEKSDPDLKIIGTYDGYNPDILY